VEKPLTRKTALPLPKTPKPQNPIYCKGDKKKKLIIYVLEI
jgi:hypothetical protein